MHRNHVLLPCFWMCAFVHAAAAAGVAAKRRPNSQLWHGDEPLVARISGIVVALLASSACAAFFLFRLVQVRSWRLLPPHGWYLLFIYVDSFSFILGSVILQYAFDPRNDSHWCAGATLLCICGYLTGKLIYLFFSDRVHIVRGCATPRLRSKFYILNNFGAILIFGAFMTVFFVYRFSHVEDGACIIGIEQRALVIPVAFDVFVSIYLSVLFIIPLMKETWNVEFELRGGRTLSLGTQAMMAHPASASLKRLATKSLIGSCVTLTSSGSNLIALLVLDGEPAWLCLICCKTDILVNALVIFWITSTRDSSASAKSLGTSTGPQGLTSRLITVPAHQQESDDPDVLPHPGHARAPPPASVSISGARPTDLSIDDILYGMENTDDFVRRNDKSPRGKQNVMCDEGLGNLREQAEQGDKEDEEKKGDPWYCSVPNGDVAAHTDTHA